MIKFNGAQEILEKKLVYNYATPIDQKNLSAFLYTYFI